MTPIDVQVKWSKVKVKLLVFGKFCPLSIFWPLCLKITKLGTFDAPWEWMFPIDVQVTWSNVKVKLLVVYSISNESSYQGQTINCNLTHRNAASKKNVALFCHQTNETDKIIISIWFVEPPTWAFIAYLQPFWILHQVSIYVSNISCFRQI